MSSKKSVMAQKHECRRQLRMQLRLQNVLLNSSNSSNGGAVAMGTLQENCAVQSQTSRKESRHRTAALSGIHLVAELCARLGCLVRPKGMPLHSQPSTEALGVRGFSSLGSPCLACQYSRACKDEGSDARHDAAPFFMHQQPHSTLSTAHGPCHEVRTI